MTKSAPANRTNLLRFPAKAEREQRNAAPAARPLEVSPPGVRQILEMARHALLFCSDLTVVDGIERGAGGSRPRPALLALEFTEEIKAIDRALAELPE